MLQGAQCGGVNGIKRAAANGHRQVFNFEFDLDDLLDLHQKPAVDFGDRMDFFHAPAGGKGVANVPDALGARLSQFFLQELTVLRLLVHAVNADFQTAQGFLERFLEGAADGHHFADRFHLRRQSAVGCGEFLEGKARNLGDDVIDAGLKTRGCRATRDVVAQLVKRVADRQLGCDLGNRKAGRLGGQGRRARNARVHLDHHHAPIIRVDGELHVGAAGIHADLAQHGQRGVAQDLVFLVAQRLCRRHGDGVAGVHTHRVQVFDRADDDAVVRLVAHHLHLKLFPAQQRFLDQQFAGRRGFEAALADHFELFRVVGNAAAGAAEREAGADHGGETERLLHGPGFVHRVRNTGARGTQTDLGHGVLELQAVFGLVDRFRAGADQLDLVFLQHTVVPQIERTVQRGLAAHGRQNGVGPFLGDDLLDRLPGDGFDVDDVGGGRVGHDRGRVAVDQNDLVAFFAQRLAGLHAGIVELAGLADDDRAGADDENTLDVGALRHSSSPGLAPSAQ